MHTLDCIEITLISLDHILLSVKSYIDFGSKIKIFIEILNYIDTV